MLTKEKILATSQRGVSLLEEIRTAAAEADDKHLAGLADKGLALYSERVRFFQDADVHVIDTSGEA